MKSGRSEILIVRSLTDSDLGIFAAHRGAARSKQRAINVNAPAAARLLDKELYANGGTTLDCLTKFDDVEERSQRSFTKVHKNWRLGGQKLSGRAYAKIDSADFALIRSLEGNDGRDPVTLTFISRSTQPDAHTRLSSLLAPKLERSVTTIEPDDPSFVEISTFSAPLPVSTSAGEDATRQAGNSEAKPAPLIELMPKEDRARQKKPRTIKEKLRSPNIMERMLRVASDLSAPAQLEFMEVVEQLASQLREVLLETGRIIKLERNHAAFWPRVAGRPIGFVDGGLANLTSLGSAPIACRVGGYLVTCLSG